MSARRQSSEPDPVLEALGARIRRAMQTRGKRVSDVADACDVRWPTAQKWVLGQSYPELARLPRLLEVLGMTAEELLGIAAGHEPPFAGWSAFLATPEGQGATQSELAALRGIAWPDDSEPTASAYAVALAALRMAARRDSVR